mmetsp:Transcript_25880/g.103446  ORF Transcript_25880/g.103446 Transcript_25880/m.103446 type:complete len:394 (-) Transcript_25880:541-1722(-)
MAETSTSRTKPGRFEACKPATLTAQLCLRNISASIRSFAEYALTNWPATRRAARRHRLRSAREAVAPRSGAPSSTACSTSPETRAPSSSSGDSPAAVQPISSLIAAAMASSSSAPAPGSRSAASLTTGSRAASAIQSACVAAASASSRSAGRVTTFESSSTRTTSSEASRGTPRMIVGVGLAVVVVPAATRDAKGLFNNPEPLESSSRWSAPLVVAFQKMIGSPGAAGTPRRPHRMSRDDSTTTTSDPASPSVWRRRTVQRTPIRARFTDRPSASQWTPSSTVTARAPVVAFATAASWAARRSARVSRHRKTTRAPSEYPINVTGRAPTWSRAHRASASASRTPPVTHASPGPPSEEAMMLLPKSPERSGASRTCGASTEHSAETTSAGVFFF